MLHQGAAASVPWPYFPTFLRLGLSLAVGLFVGIERERRRKEAGVRTFGLVALLGGIGGLLGGPFALLALMLTGLLLILLNVETIRSGEGAEITTSAALLLVAFAGTLAGQGHTFTPTAIAIATAALLTWKEPLAGFTLDALGGGAALGRVASDPVVRHPPDSAARQCRPLEPRASAGGMADGDPRGGRSDS